MRLARRLVLVGHGPGRLFGRWQRLLRGRREVIGFLVHARKRRRRLPRLRRCSVVHSSSSLLARCRPEACCEWLDCERPGALRELLLLERERDAVCELRCEPCWPDFDEDCFVMSDNSIPLVRERRGRGSRVRPMRACVLALGEPSQQGDCNGGEPALVVFCRPWLVGSATLRRADLSQDTCQAVARMRALCDKGLPAPADRAPCILQNRHIPDCKMPRDWIRGRLASQAARRVPPSCRVMEAAAQPDRHG